MRVLVDKVTKEASGNADRARSGGRAESRPPPGPAMAEMEPPAELLAIQRKMQPPAELVAVQRKMRGTNTTGLPDSLKAGVESLSGMSLNDVKVHYNSAKPARMQALAYTQGTEIHVAPGQERHLPHEAWHVVQQKQGRVRATAQLKGVGVNEDAGLEREAEVMGGRAALGMGRREVAWEIPWPRIEFRHPSASGGTVPCSPTGPIQMVKWTKDQKNKIHEELRAIAENGRTEEMIQEWVTQYWPDQVIFIVQLLSQYLRPHSVDVVYNLLCIEDTPSDEESIIREEKKIPHFLPLGSLARPTQEVNPEPVLVERNTKSRENKPPPTLIDKVDEIEEIFTTGLATKHRRRGFKIDTPQKGKKEIEIELGDELGGASDLSSSQIHVKTQDMQKFLDQQKEPVKKHEEKKSSLQTVIKVDNSKKGKKEIEIELGDELGGASDLSSSQIHVKTQDMQKLLDQQKEPVEKHEEKKSSLQNLFQKLKKFGKK